MLANGRPSHRPPVWLLRRTAILVTSDEVASTYVSPLGLFFGADLADCRTAGAEAAAGGRVDRAGDVTLQDDTPAG